MLPLILLVACLYVGCTADQKPIDSRSGILYATSFESSEDFIAFRGHGHAISDQVPPAAGDSSLLISGGCIGEHWTLSLGPYEQDKLVSISFLGMSEEHRECGYLSLCLPHAGICEPISIDGEGTWKEYKSLEPFLVLANDTLKIVGESGGKQSCLTYVDRLVVEEL